MDFDELRHLTVRIVKEHRWTKNEIEQVNKRLSEKFSKVRLFHDPNGSMCPEPEDMGEWGLVNELVDEVLSRKQSS